MIYLNLGAGDIIKVLEKAKQPLTSEEISKVAKIQGPSIRRVLRALLKDCSVNIKFRRLTFDEKKIRYGHVVNPTLIRIYWLED